MKNILPLKDITDTNEEFNYNNMISLWDNSLERNLESIYIDHDEIISSDEGLIKWLELLHHKGIAIVKNVKQNRDCKIRSLYYLSFLSFHAVS